MIGESSSEREGVDIEAMLRGIDIDVLFRHVNDRLLEHRAGGADSLDDQTLHDVVMAVHRERSRLEIAFAGLIGRAGHPAAVGVRRVRVVPPTDTPARRPSSRRRLDDV